MRPRLTTTPQPATGLPPKEANLPDSHQLFVGNLPHNCVDKQLEDLFGKYGKVVEVRISSKGASQTKMLPSGARVPNFGFVVFADEKSVQRALKEKPVYLQPDNHRLNIEEKKNKVIHYTFIVFTYL